MLGILKYFFLLESGRNSNWFVFNLIINTNKLLQGDIMEIQAGVTFLQLAHRLTANEFEGRPEVKFLRIRVCFGGRKHTQNAPRNVIFHLKLAPNQSKFSACGGPKYGYVKLILSNFRVGFLSNQPGRVCRVDIFLCAP